jgi:thiol-disulfide isomerase/thioredoxin
MSKSTVATSILLLLGIGVAIWLYQRYRVAPAMQFGQLVLHDVDDKLVSIDSLRGQPMMVNFYASWCGPCMGEMPTLMRISEAYERDSLHLICITDEPVDKLRMVAERFKSHILFLRSDSSHHQSGIYTIPTTYLINRQGQTTLQVVNQTDWERPAKQAALKAITSQ